jgi:hypothetical protein
MTVSTNGNKISRDDLERAFSQIVGDGEEAAERTLPQIVVAGAAVVLGMVALAYLAGRRRGRGRSAVVQVRRI